MNCYSIKATWNNEPINIYKIKYKKEKNKMSNTRYKVGDVLKVRNDLSMDMDFESGIIDEMLEFKGKLVEIEDAWQISDGEEIYDGYLLKGDNNCWHWNNEMFEEEVKQDIKDSKPKICEILGIELNEEFNIMGKTYLEEYNPYIFKKEGCDNYVILDNEGDILDTSDLIAIINGDLHIEKYKEEIELTDRQKEIFTALKTLGINYIATDGDGEIFGYKNPPIKDDCSVWYDDVDGINIYLDEFREELSSFIEKAEHEPFEISTLDLG